jgi:hypothetical protein
MGDFPLEKILELSLDQYLRYAGKELSEYELKAVHVEGKVAGHITTCFRSEVPEDAEIVVGFHIDYYQIGGAVHQSGYTEDGAANAHGLALIPKVYDNDIHK